MTKTPMQLAFEYCDKTPISFFDRLFVSLEEIRIGAFKNGYQAAQQWISVKDRLPENSVGWTTVYGCILSRWAVQPGFYDKEAKEWVSRFICSDETDQGYAPFESVSHWQSLPAPPEEEK